MTPDTEHELGGDPNHSIVRRAGWLTLGRLANAGSLLLAGVFLSRALSPAEYGQYQLIWVFLYMAIPLFLFGTPVSISYFLAPLTGPERDREASRHAALIGLLAGLFALCAGGLWIGGGIGPFAPPVEAMPFLPMMAIIGGGMIAGGFLEPVLVVYGRHRTLSASLLLFSFLHLAAVFGGWFLGRTPQVIFVALSFSVLLKAAWSYLLLLRLLKPGSFNLSLHRLKDQLRYAWPVGVQDGIGVLSRFADKLIFATFFTTAQFALYFNGAWELPLVSVMVQSLLAILLPEFRVACGRGDMDRVTALMRFAARRLALLVFPATAFGLALAPELMSFIFGEAYRASADVFRVFILLLPLRISTAGLVLLAINRARTVLCGTILDLVLLVALGFALIPSLGTLGPAAALVVSTCCQTCFYNWQAGKAIDRAILEILPWRALTRLGLLNLAAALGACLLVRFESPVLNLLVSGPAFLLLLVGLGFGLRLLAEEERDFVTRAWRLVAARCSGRSLLRAVRSRG